MKFLKPVFIYTLTLFTLCSFAQDLVEDLSSTNTRGDSAEIFTEKIINIARSKKVFILTNTNSLLNKGDFITLIVNDRDAAARAVVAKNHNSLVGIKILKIYSIKNWSQIYKNMDIKILKGDDSILFAPPKEATSEVDEKTKIKGEEDLYAEELAVEASFDDDSGGFENKNRHIKTDNIVSAGYGRFIATDPRNNSVGGHELTGAWAYQFRDNFWLEGLGTVVTLNDFPATTKQTVITRFTTRLKYTYSLPFYSYVMPYLGYQVNHVSSPNATSNSEKEIVQNLAIGKIAFGATLLKRLVPGWFFKLDFGNDLISIGAAIEF